MNGLAWWITAASALASCFFTATNYALLHYSRSKLAELFESRGKNTAMARFDRRRFDLLLMTALFRAAMNVVIIVGVLAIMVPPDRPHTFIEMVIAAFVAVALIAVFGVAVPISWGRHAAEPLIAISLPVLLVLATLAKPLMSLLHLFDPIVRRLLGVPRSSDDDTSPLEQEILDAVSEGEKSGLVDEDQAEMIEAVVEFPTTTVDQIMTPRTDIQGIPVESTLEQIKRIVTEDGHSRVPVYEGNLDEIVGILYVKDLIALLGEESTLEQFNLRGLLRETMFVPESKTLRDLLTQIKAQKVHIAIVIDEYGGTAGLVTIEDIIEEIVGEIQDEYEPEDEPEPGIERIDADAWQVHGRVYIDDLNDELNLELPDNEDYDTLGGFVFAQLGRVPDQGDSFDYQGLRFIITEAERTRVNQVRIESLKSVAAKAAES